MKIISAVQLHEVNYTIKDNQYFICIYLNEKCCDETSPIVYEYDFYSLTANKNIDISDVAYNPKKYIDTH